MKADTIVELRQRVASMQAMPDLCSESNNKIELNKEAKKCFKRILVLVNYRERCTEELRQRLVDREKFDIDDFLQALSKAKKYDIVNDEHYAEMYAFVKLQSNRGLDGIIRHFKWMKIDYASMPKVVKIMQEFENFELDRAKEYIKNHPSRSKNEFSGNVRKLINRGYSASIAIKASSKLLL